MKRSHASLHSRSRFLLNFQENSMSQNQSTTTAGTPTEHESEADKAKREAGVTEHSSHDHMSREKASTHEGAGGGAKQKEDH
jgi:hypothetical protein